MPSRETFLLGFLLITIICFGYIYSALGIISNNDLKCSTDISNATIDGKPPSLSIFTDKTRYMQGELIKLSGNVCDERKPSQERIIIQASKLPTTDWFSGLYQLLGKTLGFSDNSTSKPEIVYKTSIFTINGSYAVNILNTQNAGSYNITATLANLNETYFTKIEVENPFTTTTALTSIIGVVAFILVLFLPGILLEWGGIQNGVHLIEKFNFILFSTFIFAIIFALSLADVALGPNSPVGLVLKGGEWVINIGGHPNNNYTDGIEIPVYVVVFGVVGGFIRYLYETATSRREETKKDLKEIEDDINPKKIDDFKYLEMKESAIQWWSHFIHKIFIHKKDTNTNQKVEKKPNENYDDNENIILNQKKVAALHSEIRRYFLYQSLKNLALIILAPLLAIAVWFLLIQVGFQGEQADIQGQTGVFILATISFGVGLVTDEVVEILQRFTKERLGSGPDNKKEIKKLIKPRLIKVAKNPVINGEKQTIDVTISNNISDIDDAIVKGTVTDQHHGVIEKFKGLTDESGHYSYSWDINASPGEYFINLYISAKDYEDNLITTTFEVTLF